jgi:hypothetical protein
MNNKTNLNRAKNETNSTSISNSLINDKRLSLIELGIMVKVLSTDDDFIFNSTNFKKDLSIGDDRYNKAITNLIEYGYIEKNRLQSGFQWVFNEVADEQENLAIKEIEIETPLIKQNNEPSYHVDMYKFVGDVSKEDYTYQITFNKSLEHSGKFSAIEKGLNDYDKREGINKLKLKVLEELFNSI